MFNAIEFIEDKRDAKHHSKNDIFAFVKYVTDHTVADYQLSAWLMAAYLNGLSDDETLYLTEALAHSGKIIKYLPGQRAIDKHSTGGVGDKTTIILIPLVASCGARISKLSGPGLGYTGGTVDKLESIPGMDMELSDERFQRQVKAIGCAVSGHSNDLAPTEGCFYRMRDVTGTVPSIPLIVSSILSKKLAGGADGFVFDVKTGSGAFMRSADGAKKLAEKLVSVSKKLGKRSLAVISDMEQPLGEWVGNAAEIYEAVNVLSGKGPDDTRELCLTLGGYMLKIADVCSSFQEGKSLCQTALDSGKALKKFAELVKAQGGNEMVAYEPGNILPQAAKILKITAPVSGYVTKVDAKLIGEGLRALGGGRLKQEDAIDHSVAIRLHAKIGNKVTKDDTVFSIYYNTNEQIENARSYIESSCEIDSSPVKDKRQLIIDTIE